MADSRGWKEDLRGAANHIEDDLRRVVGYINDEVVPDIRRNGSQALRFAAAELEKLARTMDNSRAQTGAAAPPPPPPPVDESKL